MIEVRRDSRDDMLPLGAVFGALEFTPHYVLYDIYEDEVEFVELWIPVKEKEMRDG